MSCPLARTLITLPLLFSVSSITALSTPSAIPVTSVKPAFANAFAKDFAMPIERGKLFLAPTIENSFHVSNFSLPLA